MATDINAGEKIMDRIERIDARDHEEMYEVGWEVFNEALKTYKEKGLNALTMFRNNDVSDQLINNIVERFIYGRTSHPIIQEMAEDAGFKDWTDDDEFNYNYNILIISQHAECLFNTMLHDYKWYLQYNCKYKFE